MFACLPIIIFILAALLIGNCHTQRLLILVCMSKGEMSTGTDQRGEKDCMMTFPCRQLVLFYERNKSIAGILGQELWQLDALWVKLMCCHGICIDIVICTEFKCTIDVVTSPVSGYYTFHHSNVWHFFFIIM